TPLEIGQLGRRSAGHDPPAVGDQRVVTGALANVGRVLERREATLGIDEQQRLSTQQLVLGLQRRMIELTYLLVETSEAPERPLAVCEQQLGLGGGVLVSHPLDRVGDRSRSWRRTAEPSLDTARTWIGEPLDRPRPRTHAGLVARQQCIDQPLRGPALTLEARVLAIEHDHVTTNA